MGHEVGVVAQYQVVDEWDLFGHGVSFSVGAGELHAICGKDPVHIVAGEVDIALVVLPVSPPPWLTFPVGTCRLGRVRRGA